MIVILILWEEGYNCMNIRFRRIRGLTAFLLLFLLCFLVKDPAIASVDAESGQRYIFAEAPGHPKIISSVNLEWRIVIPESYETMLVMDGNHVF